MRVIALGCSCLQCLQVPTTKMLYTFDTQDFLPIFMLQPLEKKCNISEKPSFDCIAPKYMVDMCETQVPSTRKTLGFSIGVIALCTNVHWQLDYCMSYTVLLYSVVVVDFFNFCNFLHCIYLFQYQNQFSGSSPIEKFSICLFKL